MANVDGLTLAEINERIELLEIVERFGSEVQQFSEWLNNLSGANVTK